MWTLLMSLHVTILTFGTNFWLFYILGIPCQAIIVAWAALAWKIRKDKRAAAETEEAPGEEIAEQ